MIKNGLTTLVTLALMGQVQSQDARSILAAKMKALKERKAAENDNTVEQDIQENHKTQTFRTHGLKFDMDNKF